MTTKDTIDGDGVAPGTDDADDCAERGVDVGVLFDPKISGIKSTPVLLKAKALARITATNKMTMPIAITEFSRSPRMLRRRKIT